MNIPMPSLKPLLMGSASVAVIAIAVLATRDMPRKDELVPLPVPAELRLEGDENAAVRGNDTALTGGFSVRVAALV